MILKFHKPHHLNKLHDELLAAVPALRPTPGPDGMPMARLLIGGDGEEVELIVPDNLTQDDINKIKEVIQSHDPTPPPSTPVEPEKELVRAIDEAKTLDEIKAALKKIVAARGNKQL